MAFPWLRWCRPAPADRVLDEAIDKILAAEGGFVHSPVDRGGATNFGVTQQTLADYRGKAVSAEDVRDMAPSEARAIYRQQFFDRGRVGLLPRWAWGVALDTMVLSGVRGGGRLIQRACVEAGDPVNVDGVVGKRTAAAVNRIGKTRYLMALTEVRVSKVEAICRADQSQRVFLNGWKRRIRKAGGE